MKKIITLAWAVKKIDFRVVDLEGVLGGMVLPNYIKIFVS